jgi:hypothetical protein
MTWEDQSLPGEISPHESNQTVLYSAPRPYAFGHQYTAQRILLGGHTQVRARAALEGGRGENVQAPQN